MNEFAFSDVNEAWFQRRSRALTIGPLQGCKRSRVTGERLENLRVTVGAAYRMLNNWDRVADYYSISKGAAHRIANDSTYHPSEAVADRIESLRVPRPAKAAVDICPDCSRPHATQERCHGEPVEVVLLRPGQKVTVARKQRQYKRIADMPSNLLATMIKERKPFGLMYQ